MLLQHTVLQVLARTVEFNMPVAVVVGHSYVRRLEDVLRERPHLQNGRPDVRLEFVGIGGARLDPRVRDHRQIFDYVADVASFRPDIVFLHIGENDLRTVHPEDIVGDIIELVRRIADACSPAAIVIGQLTKFPKHAFGSTRTKYINRALEAYFSRRSRQPPRTDVSVWWHRIGIFGPGRARWYARDDIHLNTAGMVKYRKSVCTAISRKCNELFY